jgi:anti-sigma factor RsiW
MTTADESEPGDVETLLPWHAAGTLGPRDAQRVAAALAGDPELARRYELVREELAQTIHLNETLGAPSARAMTALFEKIDAEPARRTSRTMDWSARLRGFFADLSPEVLAWSAGAAVLAIVLQSAVIGGFVVKERNDYQVASVAEKASSGGTFVLVRFQPQANAADITQFLETNKLTIANGPSAGGLYRVRIAAGKLATPDSDRIVKILERDKVVSFIAPTE